MTGCCGADSLHVKAVSILLDIKIQAVRMQVSRCAELYMRVIIIINVKNKVYKNGYRRRSCTSKTAKIHHIVRLVMYCIITTCSVAFYWARSDDTVHCINCPSVLLFAGIGLSMLIRLLLLTKSFCRSLLDYFISKVVYDLFSFRHEVLANGPRLRQVGFGYFLA